MKTTFQAKPQHFKTLALYLRAIYLEEKKNNSAFSFRLWAKLIGLRSHSLLSMIVSGTRVMSPQLISIMIHYLGLSGEDAEYFKNKALNEETSYTSRFKKNVRDAKYTDQFQIIADWIPIALLEISANFELKDNPEQIKKLLDFPVSTEIIRKSIHILIKSGLMEKKNGILKRTHTSLDTIPDKPSIGAREHFKKIMELAKTALDIQTITEREYFSFMFNLKEEDIPDAKKMVREFRDSFTKRFDKPGNAITYALALQLFRLSKNLKQKN